MSDPQVLPSTATNVASSGRRRFLAGLLAGGLAGSLLATGVTALSLGLGRPAGWGRHGWHGREALTPEAARERLEFAADWMLSRVNATEEQRHRVKTILAGTLQEIAPFREQHRKNRQAFIEGLTQPSVDRAALEQLRRSELELAENASARIVQALADVADVLTPEQRAALVRLAERFHH